MHLFPICSSSAGNCTLIYNKKTKILIDSGVAVKHIKPYVAQDSVNAIFISHEHSDHCSTAGAMARYLCCPIYASKTVFENKAKDLDGCNLIKVKSGNTFEIKTLRVTTFSTKHDAKMSFGFFIEDMESDSKLCLITDTGTISPLIESFARRANTLMIETDYDDQMLTDYAEYDEWLKDRIRSDFGHLSNKQTMMFLQSLDLKNYRHIVFSHLSPRTNSPTQLTKVASDHLDKTTMDKVKIAPLSVALDLKPIV